MRLEGRKNTKGIQKNKRKINPAGSFMQYEGRKNTKGIQKTKEK